ncbi:MAG: circularly permuted type 2 ATP-grasp protein [Porticoccaceae bacterium]
MMDSPKPPTLFRQPYQQQQGQSQSQGLQTTGDDAGAFGYARRDTVADEVHDSDGAVRQHWQYLLDSLRALGPAALVERQLKAQRILRDDGATYNVSSEPLASRTWALDPVPLLIESEEWSTIEAGLIERAELLDLVLKDIYGPRELIRRGLVPPELIYSHPGFLRQCQGIQLPGDQQLIFHAVDMVRGANGEIRIIGDRTQAPSGAGYALENRSVMSRVLPSLFRDSHVHRLSMFFHTLRLKLTGLAPAGDIPQVVILTPGAYSETYFEHAYLANYLGYPLVQGGDLTVRNGRVWMKSLEGLKQVDIILRRVDDHYCDAVELRSDSQLGVPGLLDVARSGHIAIVNSLGSGVLENPALLKYLPAIGKFYFGREPRLASAETYWCGDAADRAHVIAHLDRLIIKPVFRRPDYYSTFGSELSSDQKAQWRRRLERDPLHFVAQVYHPPTFSPAWKDSQLTPRPFVLRSFAVANSTSYTVMPGGLTRVGMTDAERIITNQLGSTSKDTWVLASEPEKQVSLWVGNPAQATTAGGKDAHLPSRVAENLFWMGRYAERAEAALRHLRTVFVQLNSVDRLSAEARSLLLASVTQLTNTHPGFVDEATKANPETELLEVIFDDSRSGTVAANLNAMLTCGEEVKEILSADTRRVLNDLRDELSALRGTLEPGLGSAPEQALDSLVTTLLALAGLGRESMIRSMDWVFLQMGRSLEKSLQTATLLRALLAPDLDETDRATLLEALLLTAEMLITYRRRYRAHADVGHGLELLMLDDSNPRALLYQMGQLNEHLLRLPATETTPGLARERRHILEALTAIKLSDLAQLVEVDATSGIRPHLDQLLIRVHDLLETIASVIADKYFDHQTEHQQLVGGFWVDGP